MKKNVTSYQVVIFGEEYTVGSDESEEHVMRSANFVHALMQDIARKTPGIPLKKLAILVALRLSSKVIKAEEDLHKQSQKNSDMLQYLDNVLHNNTSDGSLT